MTMRLRGVWPWLVVAVVGVGGVLLGSCDGVGEEREGDDPGECGDGADNDSDGLFDCDDEDCAGSPACQGGDGDADSDIDGDGDADDDIDGDGDADDDVDGDSDADGDGDAVADGDGDADTDGDGDADVDGDNDWDADSGDADGDTDVEPDTCDEPPLARGVLRNSVADIDFTGEEIEYTIEHKLDIDPEEDGCIAYAEFTVRRAGLGCELSLVFGVTGGPMILLDAHLYADSFCPDWIDPDEGDYHLVSSDSVLFFVARVSDRTAEQSCIEDATASFEGIIQLEDAGRTLEIDLRDLSFEGDFLSQGNPERACPCSPNCEDRECGPDPVCAWSCGECGTDELCTDFGICECDPDCGTRECGMDPVCGTLSCGSCPPHYECNPSGMCDCIPDCGTRECGMDPICGTLDCGSCSAHHECNEATGECECVPDCGTRECGMDPICETLSCGLCSDLERCNATSGICEIPSCAGGMLDLSTGLCWQNPVVDVRRDLTSAVAYCNTLDLAGYGPGSWRLPTISELRSLIRGCPATEADGACGVTDFCLAPIACRNATCNGCTAGEGPGARGAYWPEWISGPVYLYWSSSFVTAVPSTLWVVWFDNGRINGQGETGAYYARCVRDGP